MMGRRVAVVARCAVAGCSCVAWLRACAVAVCACAGVLLHVRAPAHCDNAHGLCCEGPVNCVQLLALCCQVAVCAWHWMLLCAAVNRLSVHSFFRPLFCGLQLAHSLLHKNERAPLQASVYCLQLFGCQIKLARSHLIQLPPQSRGYIAVGPTLRLMISIFLVS